MSTRLTPALLRHCYAMLRETMPFRRWRLPKAEDVAFAVLKTPNLFGDFTPGQDGYHRIRISHALHTRLTAVMATMAHEMCHMRLDVRLPYRVARTAGGQRSKPRDRQHGAVFKRLRDQVCRHHPEFDPTTF